MAERFSIPGFKLDLTPAQQIVARTLIEENDFKPGMRGGSAKTVRFEKGRKYGYINSDVTKYGGVLGFSFPPKHEDPSPYTTKEETEKWFDTQYPGSSGKITFHSVPRTKKHYLIILDVDLALRVCGVTSKTATKISGEKRKNSDYQQVQSECITCFQKIGAAAEFTKEGNIIRCMRNLATPGWPNDWIEWVVQNANKVIKGVEIDK